MTTKKHIGLLYTGGTVGMIKTGNGYAPMPNFADVLDRLLRAHEHALPQYTVHAYEQPIDSSNAAPSDWHRIGADIAARYSDYDGFVILHGTDTMAYTASALSFMLQGLQKPVIVTGSQVPMGETRSDALQNLIASLQCATMDAINEVALYFNQHLLRGNRSTKVSIDRFDAFKSPNYPWLAEAGIGIRINSAALLPPAHPENFQLPVYRDDRILSLRFVPGMPLAVIQAMLNLQPQALILECYGAGNVPDRDPALLRLLKQASDNGIVLAVCSQCPHGQVALGAYATGAALQHTGVIGALDMTFEAVFAKLHHLFALNLPPEDVKKALLHNYCGELTP